MLLMLHVFTLPKVIHFTPTKIQKIGFIPETEARSRICTRLAKHNSVD